MAGKPSEVRVPTPRDEDPLQTASTSLHGEASPPDSPLGEAMQWVSRIFTIGLMMFLPGVAGQWLDERIGVAFLGPIGWILGFAGSLLALIRLGNEAPPRKAPRRLVSSIDSPHRPQRPPWHSQAPIPPPDRSQRP